MPQDIHIAVSDRMGRRCASSAAGRAPKTAVSRSVAEDAWDAFCAFLAEHTGRQLRLKSLAVLAQLRRAEQGEGPR